jgi:tetratricopeptide (TPR) repeat protein
MKKFFTIAFVLILALSLFAQGGNEIEKGRQLLKEGKFAEAISLLKPLAAVNPPNYHALLILGNAYLKAGKPDSAEIIGTAYQIGNGKSVDGFLLLAQAEAEQKKFTEAYATLKKGLKTNRDNLKLLLKLGWIQLSHDSTDVAIVTFSRVKELDPANAEAYNGLGDCYVKLSADVVALMQFEESLRIDSTQVEQRYKMAKLYYKERRFNEAAQMYASILRLEPENDAAALELGRLYFLAKQYGNAARVLDAYVKRHPENTDAWLQYAEAMLSARQWEVASKAAEHVIKTDPNSARALRVAAKSNAVMRNNDKAIGFYSALSKVDTLSAEDNRNWGKAYAMVKNDSLAIIRLEQSLLKDSTQSEIYADLGGAYMRKKIFDKAAVMYEKKFNQDSTYTSAYINYALCMEVLQNWEAARVALYRALRQNPSYLTSHYHLAYVLSRMDSSTNAKKEYETVITLADTARIRYKNELSDAYSYLSRYYLAEKKFPLALEALNQAVGFKPNDVDLILWRGQTLHFLGKRDEARKAYEKVLKLDPQNKDAKNGIDRLDLGF